MHKLEVEVKNAEYNKNCVPMLSKALTPGLKKNEKHNARIKKDLQQREWEIKN